MVSVRIQKIILLSNYYDNIPAHQIDSTLSSVPGSPIVEFEQFTPHREITEDRPLLRSKNLLRRTHYDGDSFQATVALGSAFADNWILFSQSRATSCVWMRPCPSDAGPASKFPLELFSGIADASVALQDASFMLLPAPPSPPRSDVLVVTIADPLYEPMTQAFTSSTADEALLDPKTWLFTLSSIIATVSSRAPYRVLLLIIIWTGITIAARTGSRAWVAFFYLIPNPFVNILPWNNKVSFLVSLNLTALSLPWLSAVTAGHTKRITTNAIVLC
ncbi:hypothetical protein C8R44DRAFT_875263 [Mycena epipterygia]|nr:hypothetical protein C8R44DRAFT_875263 [Mycena epipterygia]